MKESQYQAVAEHVPAIQNYSKEVKSVEQFLEKEGLKVEETTAVFWNHFITLLERIDEGTQNDLEFDGADEMSQAAQQMTAEFADFMNESRPFEVTEFEKYLLTLYFEQLIKGEDNHE